ncbi:pentapeptide repeat-containing protein [Mycobacterium lehmannii]|uniref:pentapeptide repeat-containing protein n=1 Tax=Mycobacterium lehmannii TaxID=2048550 RepID=UPI000B941CC4|nr:pentapeptide repeat-containing protein [Mycobacterium lehmannii]
MTISTPGSQGGDDGKKLSEVAREKRADTEAQPPSLPSKSSSPATDEAEAALAEQAGRWPLWVLVVFGALGGLILGGGSFAWLSWLLSDRPAPWNDDGGWFAWLDSVDGAALFDAARTAATLLAIIGVGGAAFVAYRRQATTELTYQFTVRAHAVAIDAQETAARQYELDSKKYELDRQRHDLETQRRIDDRERELRARFASIAAQLDAERFAERHAAVFALASLADDWHRAGNDVERQACVDLFCAQLRSRRVRKPFPREEEAGIGPTTAKYMQDAEIRNALVALLRSHRPLVADSDDNWKSCLLDLSGADLSGFYFKDTDLRGVNLDDANLSDANMVGADLCNATMVRAILSSANFEKATMVNARLHSTRIVDSVDDKRPWGNAARFNSADLRRAWFTNARLKYSEFDGADFTGAKMDRADLRNCHFVAATLTEARCRESNLEQANFARAELRFARFIESELAKANFSKADLRDTDFRESDLTAANFERIRHNAGTRWPNEEPPGNIGQPELSETETPGQDRPLGGPDSD